MWARLSVLSGRAQKALRALCVHRGLAAMAYCGVAAAVEDGAVLTQLRCDTVVDVGSNRGQFSLIARHHFRGAMIFAFEPLARPAATFARIFRRDPMVRLFRHALGDEDALVAMHVAASDDSSSLLPIGEAQERLFSGTGEVARTGVRVRRLQDVLSREDLVGPSLLKIDVQGTELQVLRGCGSMLDAFSWVYVECSFVELYCGQALADEIISWLRERGFALCGVYNMVYDQAGQAVQADFLFQRRAAD